MPSGLDWPNEYAIARHRSSIRPLPPTGRLCLRAIFSMGGKKRIAYCLRVMLTILANVLAIDGSVLTLTGNEMLVC